MKIVYLPLPNFVGQRIPSRLAEFWHSGLHYWNCCCFLFRTNQMIPKGSVNKDPHRKIQRLEISFEVQNCV
jgi:mannose-1-phosphate guanylyltransferase